MMHLRPSITWQVLLLLLASDLQVITANTKVATAENVPYRNDACSGHGKVDDSGACICDVSFPTLDEQQPALGYTGSQCEIPIYPVLSAKGDELTSNCTSTSDKCDQLKGDQWVCFGFALTGDPYLAIVSNRTSSAGDPDLYGYFFDPSQPNKRPQFSSEIGGFDFQETGATTFSKVIIGDLAGKQGGVVACVHAYGSQEVAFTLKATLDPCPNSIYAGKPYMCHTARDADEDHSRYTECTAKGECVCKQPYARPVPEVFPGLGFEDCSAVVTIVEDSSSYSKAGEQVYSDYWHFYGFNITEEDFQIVVDVVQEQSLAEGRVDLFGKEGTPPGYKARQFDKRPAWNSATDDRSLQISIDRSDEKFRPGPYFVGVFGSDGGATYDISITRFDCPFNCSSNGNCDASTHQCACNDGFGGPSCSISLKQINYTEPVSASGSFDYQYWKLPPVTDEMLVGNVEIIIKVTMESAIYSHHLEARPAILIAPAPSDDVFPTTSNFTHRLVLDADGETRSLALCPSQLVKGDWKVAIYNPMPTYPLNYTLTAEKFANCLNNCSNHGDCNENGVCQCATGWLGGDCSVEEKPPPPSPPSGGMSGVRVFWTIVMSLALGSIATFVYIHFHGLPRWLPLRVQYFETLGLYQELSGNDGI